MNDRQNTKSPSDAHNKHHAEKRRLRREASHAASGHKAGKAGGSRPKQDGEFNVREGRVLLYGLHTVRHALANPARRKHKLFVTKNALARLECEPAWLEKVTVEETEPRQLDKMVGSDAVHQGAVLEADLLHSKSLKELSQSPLVLVLDQVTDPHNVGAIMRSAVAMGAGALVTTNRHSPAESGVLAKSASGALDMIEHVAVRNLAEAIEELAALGYQTVGLDSEGGEILEKSLSAPKLALVLGAEGKGLRQKTRETCTTLARIDLPGQIRSLNVSNAAVLSLYIARRHVDGAR
jgi:23S rRNA (guanosine2251-2'-O)-methyltransferase